MGFIGVFVMSGDSDIRKFAEANKMTFPVGKDNGLAVTLGARGIPLTVYVDRKGRIVKKQFGEATYADLSSGIEAIIK